VVSGLSHQEIEALLGAYALDALEPDERQVVEVHLSGCEICSREVFSLREVAALLATSGAEAPEGLWDRIAEELDEAPPPLRLVAQPMGSPTEPPRSVPVVDPNRASRQAGARLSRRALAVLGSVVAVAAAVLGVVIVRDGDGSSPPTVEAALASDAEQARAEPGSREAALRTPDGAFVATVVLRPDGEGYVVGEGTGLPVLATGIYQMWGAYGGDIVSLGTMGAAPNLVEPFRADPGAEAFMVTVEDHPVSVSEGSLAASGELA
jgi:hypothetical protein